MLENAGSESSSRLNVDSLSVTNNGVNWLHSNFSEVKPIWYYNKYLGTSFLYFRLPEINSSSCCRT